MISINTIKKITVVWAYDGSSYVYQALPNSITVNPIAESILFVLREVDGQDHNLEVVIQKLGDSTYVFKTDYYEDPEKEYPLKAYSSEDELLFHFNGNEGVAYFHLSPNE